MICIDILIIGIAGGTGSGKTSLANKIKGFFNDHVSILSLDFYYKDNSHIKFYDRININYDCPTAFDVELLVSDIEKLKNNNTIFHPIYDYKKHNRTPQKIKLKPTKVLIIEGILLLSIKEILDLLDIKIYIDCDDDIRVIRRLVRDVKERGRDIDSVVHQYLTTTKVMHNMYVNPSKENADIIIKNVLENDVVFDFLIHKINAFIKNEK